MKRAAALLLLLSLFTLSAWTLEDCVEVNFDHPDCDQYGTTTTEAPSTTSSTQPGSTTSTSGAENSTTTSIRTDQPTTTVTSDTPTPTPTTTSTIQECPPGMIHQPPMCVPTTVPFFDTTTVPDTTDSTNAIPEELPRTGATDLPLLALSLVGLSVLGFTALRYGRNAE